MSNIKTSINPLITEKFGHKMKYIPSIMKFSNDNRASLLIINMIFEVVDPDLDWFDLK